MTLEVVLATKNQDKVPEIESVMTERLLGVRFLRDLEWPDVDETGDTLEANALLKARTVARVTGRSAVGDDTGLEVDALDGAPGVRSARYSGPGATYESNRAALLEALGDAETRTARFRTVAAYVEPDGREIVAEGALEGVITREERGGYGFGYDPVFELPDGRTLAEVEPSEKAEMSHRARAFTALCDALVEAGVV